MKKLPPFKFFMLQNFPFIEAVFDDITNYELMCKIVEYVNKIAKNTNEMGQEVQNLIDWFNNLDVQDEVDTKLDEMAEDGTLAEIINEELFNELDEKIDNNIIKTNNNEFLLTDECKIYFPYRGTNASDSAVILNSNKVIVIDVGHNAGLLITWLGNKGITHVDYIIVSHYHSDHIGGYSGEGIITLLNDSLCDDTTVVYLPHKDIDWSQVTASDKNQLMIAENAIKSECTTLGITYIEPDNNDVLELSDIADIKFLNIGASFYSSYYGLSRNQYNNFSMCCELRHNNRYVLFTGDIYVPAEANITPYIHEIDILKAPHHNLEQISSEIFLKKMTTKVMVFLENQNYANNCNETQLAQTIKNNNGNIYSSNVSQDVTVILKNDNIITSSTNGVYSLQNQAILTSAGLHLANDTDLNDVIDQGNYFTNNNTETNTLEHLPLADQNTAESKTPNYGRCKIINIGINVEKTAIKQFFISPNLMFYRMYVSGTWSKWINLTNESVLGLTDNMIPMNADLDDYYEIGKYTILNNTYYNSLSNIPVEDQGGSTLLVISTRELGDERHQILMTATDRIFKRRIEMKRYNDEVNNISDWKEFTLASIE